MNKLILNTAIAAGLGIVGFSGNANASLAADAVLDFVDSSIERTCLAFPDPTTTSGCAYDAFTDEIVGSYFAMDTDGSGIHEPEERTMIVSSGNGVTMGTAQAAGSIDSWSFFGAPGFHFTTAGPTVTTDDGAGNATASLNWWVN